MKTFIYFNLKDKPENMGQSQLTDDLELFIKTNSEILVNAKVDGNKLIFDKEEGQGYAIVSNVPEDFEN